MSQTCASEEAEPSTPEKHAVSDDQSQSEDEILVISKNVRLPSDLPVFDEDFYRWKKSYWTDQMKNIKNVVAPMVDQSELAFRMMLRKHGADLCYTPMIHAHLFVNDFTYRKTAFSTIPADRPLIVQFCANDAKVFLDACRLVEGFCDGVDLNLGCPQLIAKRGRYGAFLQESPELISSMVQMVFKHCRLPLSVKIRVLNGVNETIKYARLIQDAGASMLTVHGRIREQRGVLTGIADWTIIQKVKEALVIPVVANGNIQIVGDVEKCIAATGVDAVMSAEGVLANPTLFAGQNLYSCEVAKEYLDYAEKYKAGVSAVRAHVFRICHYSLLEHGDLRDKTSYVFTIPDFRKVVEELESRTHSEMETQGLINRSWENFIETLPKFSTLNELIDATPSWFCKPYVRPLPASDEERQDKPYRVQRNAELDRMSEEMGISKRQVRRREHRQIETKRNMCKKPTYPRCERCQQPAGVNCKNSSCRKCCKWICVRKAVDCKVHRFDHEKMIAKRIASAESLGLSVEELLVSEANKDEQIKALKNQKKERWTPKKTAITCVDTKE